MGGFGQGGWLIIVCSYVVTVLRPQISSPKQRGLVGWASGRGQKTQWLGWWRLFPFPPSGSFQGLRCCCGLFLLSSWPACLSPRKFRPGVRGTQGRKRSSVRAAFPTPWRAIFVVPKHTSTSRFQHSPFRTEAMGRNRNHCYPAPQTNGLRENSLSLQTTSTQTYL